MGVARRPGFYNGSGCNQDSRMVFTMNRTLETYLMVATWLLLIIALNTCGILYSAKAQDKTALHLAQCLMAEEDGQYPDKWPAHAWVLRKRIKPMEIELKRKVSFDEAITNYCAVFDRRGTRYYGGRADKIRRSTFQNPLHGKAFIWKRLQRFVQAFLQGTIPDPCPVARYFGNAADVKGKPIYIEVCRWLGKRGNKFFRVGG